VLLLGKIEVGKYNDGEICIKIDENVRGKDFYVIQPLCSRDGNTLNDSIMELLLVSEKERKKERRKKK